MLLCRWLPIVRCTSTCVAAVAATAALRSRTFGNSSWMAKRAEPAALPSAKRLCTTVAGASGAPMLDDEDWAAIQQHLKRYDEQREDVIKRCRDAQKLSKQAIYSLHRGDIQKASQQLQQVEGIAAALAPILEKEPSLRPGSYSNAMEEYAEGMVFRCFLQEGRVLRMTELPLVQTEEYLGGVLDFTGELNRWAIMRATARDKEAVAGARDLVDGLMGRFLEFDLRNGLLRKKFDSVKYTLKKLENTMYELTLAEATGLGMRDKDVGEDAEMQETAA